MAAALTLNARLNVWSSTMLGLILTSNFSTDSFFLGGGGFVNRKPEKCVLTYSHVTQVLMLLIE